MNAKVAALSLSLYSYTTMKEEEEEVGPRLLPQIGTCLPPPSCSLGIMQLLNRGVVWSAGRWWVGRVQLLQVSFLTPPTSSSFSSSSVPPPRAYSIPTALLTCQARNLHFSSKTQEEEEEEEVEEEEEEEEEEEKEEEEEEKEKEEEKEEEKEASL